MKQPYPAGTLCVLKNLDDFFSKLNGTVRIVHAPGVWRPKDPEVQVNFFF